MAKKKRLSLLANVPAPSQFFVVVSVALDIWFVVGNINLGQFRSFVKTDFSQLDMTLAPEVEEQLADQELELEAYDGNLRNSTASRQRKEIATEAEERLEKEEPDLEEEGDAIQSNSPGSSTALEADQTSHSASAIPKDPAAAASTKANLGLEELGTAWKKKDYGKDTSLGDILIVVATCKKNLEQRVAAIARTWAHHNLTLLNNGKGTISVWYFLDDLDGEYDNATQPLIQAGLVQPSSIKEMKGVPDDEYPPVVRHTKMAQFVARELEKKEHRVQ